MHRLATLLLLGACASVDVRVAACRDGDGVRACFRRAREGTAGHLATLAADAGELTEVTHSPDRLSVSVHWKGARGKLRCTFPYGGTGEFIAGTEIESPLAHYVFLDEGGVRVWAHLPSVCPMRASVATTIELPVALLPASIAVEDGPAAELSGPRTPWTLTLAEGGLLVERDLLCTIRCADGTVHRFLVGIDADGTPSATSGVVRNW